nr:hypothetical protein [Gemmatimonadota bacterium]
GESKATVTARSYIEELISSVGKLDEFAATVRKDPDISTVGAAKKIKERALLYRRHVATVIDGQHAIFVATERKREIGQLFDRLFAVPSSQHEILLMASVRDHVARLPASERTSFLSAYAGDRMLAAAIATAPPYLVGLDAQRRDMFLDMAKRRIHPDEVAELEEIDQAVAEVYRSVQEAEKMLAEVADLRVARDGETWLARHEEDTTKRREGDVRDPVGDLVAEAERMLDVATDKAPPPKQEETPAGDPPPAAVPAVPAEGDGPAAA